MHGQNHIKIHQVLRNGVTPDNGRRPPKHVEVG